MTDHDADIAPVSKPRWDITIGLLLCEVFGAVFLVMFLFFPPAPDRVLVWSLNITFLIPIISMWAIVFSIWLIERGEYVVAAFGVIAVSIGSSLYGLKLIYQFHYRWMFDVILPERSLSVVLGIALGAVLLRMAIVAVSPLRPAILLRGILVIASICVMIAGGYAAYVTPALLTSDYSVRNLPRWDITGMVNMPGPEMDMATLDGSVYRLEDDRGKVVLMNFWATWCGPCVLELPHLQRLYEDMDPEKARLITVCFDEDTTGVRHFMDSLQLTFPVLRGSRELAGVYGISTIPTTLIIDTRGIIRKVKVGFSGEEDIDDMSAWITKLVRASRTASGSKDLK